MISSINKNYPHSGAVTNGWFSMQPQSPDSSFHHHSRFSISQTVSDECRLRCYCAKITPENTKKIEDKVITAKQLDELRGYSFRKLILSCNSIANDPEHMIINKLQGMLREAADTLNVLDISFSAISGRLFYVGKEYIVTSEDVSVEAEFPVPGTDRVTFMVRDYSPPSLIRDGNQEYRYVKTVYRPKDRQFWRYYVLQDWLTSLYEIDLRGTLISGMCENVELTLRSSSAYLSCCVAILRICVYMWAHLCLCPHCKDVTCFCFLCVYRYAGMYMYICAYVQRMG